MKLSKYKEDYDTLTGKASDAARQLSFAGIAVVWIFKQGEGVSVSVPKPLLLSLVFFGLSLLFDILQYVLASIIWGHFHRKEEKKLKSARQDPDLAAPNYYNWPGNTCFFLKIVSVVYGYVVFIQFLSATWLK